MLVMLETAKLVLTDSGGIPKEAYFMQTPCITLRDETEWIETLENGFNTLAGANPERMIDRGSASRCVCRSVDAALRQQANT